MPKAEHKTLNPSWIHKDRPLPIHRMIKTSLVTPCFKCEHMGLLGRRLDKD